MTSSHVEMEQLIAVRDGDRSEPAFVAAHAHVQHCTACREELERLHQRTARLRALSTLSPAVNDFPAITTRLANEKHTQRKHRFAVVGLAAAAALLFSVVGHDLTAPPALDASAQIRAAMDRNAFLEETLDAWQPDGRVGNTNMLEAVVSLEDRIANVDVRLARTADLQRSVRTEHQLELWQERVGLMTALVDVHLTRTANVDL